MTDDDWPTLAERILDGTEPADGHVDDRSRVVRGAAARAVTLTPHGMHRLAGDTDTGVRALLAARDDLDAETLDRLSWDVPRVVAVLARYHLRDLTVEQLGRIRLVEDADVQEALLQIRLGRLIRALGEPDGGRRGWFR